MSQYDDANSRGLHSRYMNSQGLPNLNINSQALRKRSMNKKWRTLIL